MLASVGVVIDDSNGITGFGRIGRGRGTTGDSKYGARGVRGQERGGAGRDDEKLKIGGLRGIPTLGLEWSLIRTWGGVDIVPGVNAGCANTRSIEVYVDVGS